MSATRAFFQEHGYFVARKFVPRERVLELETVLDEVMVPLPTPEPDTVWEVAGLSRVRPELDAHARDPRLAQLASEVLGASELQLLQDTALVKLAEVGGEVAWHQDHTYTGYLSPPAVVSLRLSLTCCTIQSGCLEVIDGSHCWGPLGEALPFTEGGVVDVLGARALDPSHRIVALELEPGDVTLHHCLTVHRSGANRSAAHVKTLVTRLFDAQSVLVPERLPQRLREHFPTREGGQLDPAAFPRVFSRKPASESRR